MGESRPSEEAIALFTNVFGYSPDPEALHAGECWQAERINAALRAAKVEGLADVARYCRGECVVQCDDKDRWQKGHNVAAEHIAKYCDRKVDEVKS